MTYRLTNIYTRKGDKGFTQLGDKPISKDDLLIEALGAVDELNAAIGVVLAQPVKQAEIVQALRQVQHELFDLGCELHMPERVAIKEAQITRMEQWLDQWNSTLPPLKEFVLPGGNMASATCHVARTVCRRAERCLVHLHRQVPLSNTELLRYLNRLSDVLFVVSRMLAREGESDEILWDSVGKK